MKKTGMWSSGLLVIFKVQIKNAKFIRHGLQSAEIMVYLRGIVNFMIPHILNISVHAENSSYISTGRVLTGKLNTGTQKNKPLSLLKKYIHFSDFISMKMNIQLSVILILIMAYLPIYSQNVLKSDDPLGDSYIINNLEMESAIAPDADTSESLNGEILYDDSFNDSIKTTGKNIKRKTPDLTPVKVLQKKDSRWHLAEYRVKKFDNIWKIAKKNGVRASDIISLNNLSSKGIIKENDILLVPSKTGVEYKIKAGDTLSSIADKYNTDVEKIAEHNDIDGKKIFAGRTIFIPGAIEKKEINTESDKKILPDRRRNIASERAGKTGFTERQKTGIASETVKKKDNKLYLAWPLRGPITSGFGYRKHPLSGEKSFHCGLDIGAEVGTPVRASGEGKVIFSGWKEAYGNLIVVQHKNNYITVYAHNSKLLVEVNENIKKGQKVALSGKTGATTGAHLHFEIRKGIVPLNPARILK